MRLIKTYIYTILLISLANSLENNIDGSHALNDTFLAKLTCRPSISCLVVNMMYLDYWKDIKGYEDKYSGSYGGNIRSWGRYVSRRCGVKYFRKGRILRPSQSHRGYLSVVLCDGNGKLRKRINRLIAETFIKNPNNYPQVNHKIPIKTINFACNLEWCTCSMNLKHAYKNGLASRKGEKHNLSKLTEKQVIEIKARLLQGCKCADIAKQYGVNPVTISSIKTGRTWSHINV